MAVTLCLLSLMPRAKVLPYEITYRAASALGKRKIQGQLTWSLLNLMPRAKALPEEITYCSAVKGGQWQLALSAESAEPHARAKVLPNESTYCAAISSGRRQLALSLISLIPRITGYQVNHIQCTISACEMDDQWQSR
jgi:hypothetical protein